MELQLKTFQTSVNQMAKKKMNKEKNQNDGANFTQTVEKKIQEAITKGKDQKVISEPKPKSGKGL
jgi:hypothetical protein